jgi:hypothetical protein
MLTGPSDPRLRRYRPLLALAAGLLIALVATSGAIALAERDSERSAKNCSGSSSSPDATASSTAAVTHASLHEETEAAASTADTSAPANDDDASTGLDLEVRIGRIRVEFPWLKTLPISPGRHVVFTLLPSVDSESR